MGKNKKYYLNVIFMAVLLAAVFYVLLKDQDLNDILNAMRGAKKFDMILSMFAALVYVIMEGVSMQIILHSLDFKKQGLKCVKYSFIGFFFNAITPSASGGQPMQVYYICVPISGVLMVLYCLQRLITFTKELKEEK